MDFQVDEKWKYYYTLGADAFSFPPEGTIDITGYYLNLEFLQFENIPQQIGIYDITDKSELQCTYLNEKNVFYFDADSGSTLEVLTLDDQNRIIEFQFDVSLRNSIGDSLNFTSG